MLLCGFGFFSNLDKPGGKNPINSMGRRKSVTGLCCDSSDRSASSQDGGWVMHEHSTGQSQLSQSAFPHVLSCPYINQSSLKY